MSPDDGSDHGDGPGLSPADDARIRRLLAEARHTEPMPGDVVARLDRVLAGLAEERKERLAPVVELASRRRRTAASLLVAAAAVVVVGVGISRVLPDHGVVSSGGDAADLDPGGRRGGLRQRTRTLPERQPVRGGSPGGRPRATARRPHPVGALRARRAPGTDHRLQEQPPGLRRLPSGRRLPDRRPRPGVAVARDVRRGAGVPRAASAGRGHPGRRPLPVRRHRPTPVDHAHHAVAGPSRLSRGITSGAAGTWVPDRAPTGSAPRAWRPTGGNDARLRFVPPACPDGDSGGPEESFPGVDPAS